ncbi:hypothetical protein L1887_39412 [Cichorium endivia]|nr:hypothetical protein L1887_39412 [Cichorium endivia]
MISDGSGQARESMMDWGKPEITGFGFSRSEDESYVYVKASGSGVVFLVMHVDDILLKGNDIPTLESVKACLGNVSL